MAVLGTRVICGIEFRFTLKGETIVAAGGRHVVSGHLPADASSTDVLAVLKSMCQHIEATCRAYQAQHIAQRLATLGLVASPVGKLQSVQLPLEGS